ncbi:uncharacterized protein G2W53_022608 [Senna tora]|uniref:Uncharacterized protein n=1 Tax=Senna tora TaxID=362788 RepID=A0A834WPA3_9FABA|nr:uncharacterized protein G2W53_022608 [Senna tora]
MEIIDFRDKIPTAYPQSVENLIHLD